jgi:hypothetical protein
MKFSPQKEARQQRRSFAREGVEGRLHFPKQNVDLESGHVSRITHACVVCRNDLRDDSSVLARCSPACEAPARARPFTIAGDNPVLVHHDGDHLFHDLAVAPERSLPCATCLDRCGVFVWYRDCYLSSLTLGLVARYTPERRWTRPPPGTAACHFGNPSTNPASHLPRPSVHAARWTVGSGENVLYGLTVFALLTGWPMIRQEEAELESRFGDEYRAYRRAVPAALIPSVLHSRLAKSRQP